MLKLEKNKEKINQEIFTHLNFEDDCYKILNDENEVVGYIDYIYPENLINENNKISNNKQSHILYICMMEILDSHRGKGYGSQLINTLFDKYPDLLVIEGSSLALDTSFNFWQKNNAIFKTCIHCSHYDNCERKTNKKFYCDAPEDYSFTIFRG